MDAERGYGWSAKNLMGGDYLISSTHGGVRAPDGTPIALGYHTGHSEVGLLVEEAARTIAAHGRIPFAAACTDPCDGRSQGNTGMFDSLPYRNDAAAVLRRLIRSLPTRQGVLGIATCDKGLPAMIMALAAMRELPRVLVPGRSHLTALGWRRRWTRADDRCALRNTEKSRWSKRDSERCAHSQRDGRTPLSEGRPILLLLHIPAVAYAAGLRRRRGPIGRA